MIRILADSPDDATLIAGAVGGTAQVAKDADQFTNGDGHVECLILGCRHPVPARKIELLREIERNMLWIPLILVTDPEPESARRLRDVKVSAIVWFADLQTKLRLEIEAARGSVPLLCLAEDIEGSTLPPALRSALAYSLRAATSGPVRNVKELAAALSYSPITISKEFSRWQGGGTTLARFLGALVFLRARQLHYSSGLGWKCVAARLGFARETLQRKSKRWTGYTLRQLGTVSPDQLLAALVSEYLRPLLDGGRRNR
ncbi:hypothetical protein [Candidatus Palauibacter sp.]|uniref:hypothetical protein n=1 Tax=Candidatus Palauibacter sp. TaxID=3101350 RepID=UPI003AF2EB35